MKRGTWAGLLAVVLVLGLSVVAARKPVPYATFAPGPTVNVLGKSGKKDIISVSGHKAYRDSGALRLVTVIPSAAGEKISIPQLVTAWIDPNRAVYPYAAIYPPTATQKSVRNESTQQMVSSQDNAVAAAFSALHIPYRTGVQVTLVEKGGPATGKLEVGDQVLAVNGTRIQTINQLTAQIRPKPIGTKLSIQVKRNGKVLDERMATTSSTQNPKLSAVRVGIAACCYKFPFHVGLNLDQNIGGPSGGLMFALGIYDVLTPGSLTGGKAIAGTGEIDAQGNVGEIGGIQQKLVGAQDDGAKLFLVPAANCAEALGGHYDPGKMRLVKVTTLKDAIGDVQAWEKNPGAQLTRCTK
jgi:PDZ domain-containing protein